MNPVKNQNILNPIHPFTARMATEFAFSRLIITKTKIASLTADVFQSRPNKVYDATQFDFLNAFSISRINEIFVENGLIIRKCYQMAGLKIGKKIEGGILQNERYVLPLSYETFSSFKKRRRTDSVIRYSK